MKKIIYSIGLLSLLGYAGGDLRSIDVNYDESSDVEQNVVVEKVPEKIKVKEKIVVPEVKTPIKTSPLYVGLSVGRSDIDAQSSTTVLKNAHPTVAIGKIGYNIIDNLAIEGRGAIGLNTQDIGFSSSKVDNIIGAYLKPNVDVTKEVNLYGLLGYSRTKQTVGGSESLVTKGASYGLGANYALSKNISLVMDAVRYGNKGTEKIDLYSIGFDYNF